MTTQREPMQATNLISPRFEDNGSFHNDLVLRIGNREWRCDSYYLAIERAMLPDREDAASPGRPAATSRSMV